MRQGAKVVYLLGVCRAMATQGARRRIEKGRIQGGQPGGEGGGVRGIEGKEVYSKWAAGSGRVR